MMTSKSQAWKDKNKEAYVWIWLPDQTKAIVAGKLETDGDTLSFNHGKSYLILITHPKFPNAAKLMAEPWARNQRLHPVLSNLLPEGSLRELIAQALETKRPSQMTGSNHVVAGAGFRCRRSRIL